MVPTGAMLRTIQQLSTKETAACLDIPESAVKTRLHRASKLVRARVSEELASAEGGAFEFAGERCERIRERVLARNHGVAGELLTDRGSGRIIDPARSTHTSVTD